MARRSLTVLPLALFLLLSAASTAPESPIAWLFDPPPPRREISASPRGSRSSPLQWRSRLRLGEKGVDESTCSYDVTIWTSSSSPNYTRDEISLKFGDHYGNEVYVPRLDDPSSGAFKRCSADYFRITGPCTYVNATCLLYLHRYGRDGWLPHSVQISVSGFTRISYFHTALPNDEWFGYDDCGFSSTNLRASSYRS